MIFCVFDMLIVTPEQVYDILNSMAKPGLVGGVYLWINRENGKMYVGSSGSMYKRIHRYFSNKSHGIIKQALLKYGPGGFFLVILLIPDATTSTLLALEQFVLDSGMCAYNICPVAGSCAGYKHTDEARANMSGAQKGNKNAKGYKQTEEHKAKVLAKISKPVYLYLVHTDRLELSASFPSTVRASETLGIPLSTIFNRIKNRTLFRMNGLLHIISRDGNLS